MNTNGDSGPVTMGRRLYGEVGLAAAAVVLLPFLAGTLAARLEAVIALDLVLYAILGGLALWRWDAPMPFRAPWPRIGLVTVALLAVSLWLPSIAWRSGGLELPDKVSAWTVVLALVLVPGGAGQELFTRGALYSLLERWGTPAAVIGAAVPATLAALATVGVSAALPALGDGLIFGFSRASTGTVAPAVIARSAVVFLVALFLLAA